MHRHMHMPLAILSSNVNRWQTDTQTDERTDKQTDKIAVAQNNPKRRPLPGPSTPLTGGSRMLLRKC